MSDCCSPECKTEKPRRLKCPRNGKVYMEVSAKTMWHHLKMPWIHQLQEQAYYFCDDPDCDVVYFGQDGTLFTQDDLRSLVGQKIEDSDRTLCYCFGVRLSDYQSDKRLKNFVVEQTKAGVCACDIRNPSGRCCLKDFP